MATEKGRSFSQSRKIAELSLHGRRIVFKELVHSDLETNSIEIRATDAKSDKEIATVKLGGNLHGAALPNHLFLYGLHVIPEYRKFGFGNNFLALICHLAKKNNTSLALYPHDPALERSDELLRAWYRMHGFNELPRPVISGLLGKFHGNQDGQGDLLNRLLSLISRAPSTDVRPIFIEKIKFVKSYLLPEPGKISLIWGNKA
ncbi:MAG: hypothetical protein V1835_04765 [Candidatus Micrarchaeota archaeon]